MGNNIAKKALTKAQDNSADLAQITQGTNLYLNDLMALDPTLRYKEYIKTMGTLLDNMSATTGWAASLGTMVLDTTYVKTGTASIKLTNNTLNSACYITKTVSMSFSSMSNIVLRFYVPDITKINNVRFYISSSTSVTTYYDETIDSSDIQSGWNTVRIPKSEFSNTGEAWTNTMVRIRLRFSPATDQYASVIFDSIYQDQQSLTKAIITFDDGFKSVYEKALPLMIERGMVGTMYVIPSRVASTSEYMTEAELSDMYHNYFWDLGNHTYNHAHLRDITPAQVIEEVTSCANWLNARGFTRASRHLAYPFGEYNDSVIQSIMSAGIKTAREVYGGDTYPQQYPIDNQYTLNSLLTLIDTTTAQNCTDAIDRAILHQSTIIIYGHRIQDVPTDSIAVATSVFTALLDYLVEKNIPTMTISEWARKSRNANIM